MKRLSYLLFLFSLVSCSILKPGTNKKKVEFVKIETDSGTMVAKLYNTTPLTTNNFVKLVKKHFYDGLLFHRVIKGFMIQGGDPQSKNAKPGDALGEGGLSYTIPAEFNAAVFHKKGALAMARESNDVNPSKASSSTQFYIVEGRIFNDDEMDKIEDQFKIRIPEAHREVYRTVGGTPFLDMNYTVFGEVVEGLDVIDKIAGAEKDKRDRPLKDIKMNILLMKKSEAKKYK